MSRISSATIDTFLYTKYEVREDVAAAFVCLEQSRSDTLTISRNVSSEIQNDISLFAALAPSLLIAMMLSSSDIRYSLYSPIIFGLTSSQA